MTDAELCAIERRVNGIDHIWRSEMRAMIETIRSGWAAADWLDTALWKALALVEGLQADIAQHQRRCGTGAHLYITDAVSDGQRCVNCNLPFVAAGKVGAV